MIKKWVVFDAFGTLFDFCRPIAESYSQFYAMIYGHPQSANDINKAFVDAFRSVRAKYPNYIIPASDRDDPENMTHQWWRLVVERTFGLERTIQSQNLTQALMEFYSTSEAYTVRPGIESTLRELKRYDEVKLGVLSNCDDRLDTILSALGLGKYFDITVESQTAGVQKPDRRIFDHFKIQAAPLHAADEWWYIGNDKTLDYDASRSAGWNAILLEPHSQTTAERTTETERQLIGHIFGELKIPSQYVKR
eukprot:Partr_v1_DN26256_c0_g2_i2_m48250 putative Haloacid dehalogenase-like hydrolase